MYSEINGEYDRAIMAPTYPVKMGIRSNVVQTDYIIKSHFKQNICIYTKSNKHEQNKLCNI